MSDTDDKLGAALARIAELEDERTTLSDKYSKLEVKFNTLRGYRPGPDDMWEDRELPLMHWASPRGRRRVVVRACYVEVTDFAGRETAVADPRDLFPTLVEAEHRVQELDVLEQLRLARKIDMDADKVHTQLQALKAQYDDLKSQAEAHRTAALTRQKALRQSAKEATK